MGIYIEKMPKIFVEIGHGLTDLVIDTTEFKFQHAFIFELNSCFQIIKTHKLARHKWEYLDMEEGFSLVIFTQA